jgi:carboxymethylenebutenolidase
MTDADLMLTLPDLEFGSGIVGVCDVCGKRQAVIVLQKERYKLCVIDFLNKKWIGSSAKPGVPAPLFRSERIFFPTTSVKAGQAQAVVLSPTRVVKHPAVLITPDVHGLTTAILDGAIRLAQQGFEVLLPDVNLAGTFGPPQLFATRSGVWARSGVPLRSSAVRKLTDLYADGLEAVRARPMVDPEKSAVLGLSYGGALAVGVAGRDQKLGAVVLAYPVPVHPAEWLKLVTAPVLLIAGRKDRLGRRAREQFVAQLPKERVEWFDAGNVGHDFLARDVGSYDLPAAEATWKRIGEFLAGRLMPPPPKPPTPPVAASPPAAAPRPPAPVPPAAPASPAPAHGAPPSPSV